MDRSTKKDYEWLLERSQTAYELLGVEPSAGFDDIRKAYRKKALLLHPDKNKEDDAEEKFREVNVSYAILTDDVSKGEYDEHLRKRKNIKVFHHNAKSSAKVSKLKSDLRQRESAYKSEKFSEAAKLEKIEKLSKWYDEFVKEKSSLKKSNRTEASQIETPVTLFPRKTIVKWKNRNAVLFDEELLVKLMEVFGPVESVQLDERNKPEDGYHYATLIFKSPVGSALAATHDFSKTADHWDSMNLRKVSSLLRSVKLVGYDYTKLHNNNIHSLKTPLLDYIAINIYDNMRSS